MMFCVFIPYSQRVDMYLSALFWELSRSYIQKCIDQGKVTLNGKNIHKNIKVKTKDEIIFRDFIESSFLEAQNIPLDIIYEDDALLVINKDAGINVHPTPGLEWKKWTIVNAVLHHCKEVLPIISWEERPWIVHRLDKDTSGCLMIAKNDLMMKYLSSLFQQRNIKKYYIAVVFWIFPDTVFTIQSEIGRHPTDKTKMTVKNPLNPKRAVTHGTILGYIGSNYSVLKIHLETGRTHQIRVHLASIGFPIIQDKVYGNDEANKKSEKDFGLTRQALHAFSLECELYGTPKKFFAPLKPDMEAIIGNIFRYENT